MKVVITGATGNVGTSTVKALSESPEIDAIVGVARRKPTWAPPKTTWVEANVLNDDLGKIFAGADAVIHLAWAIQPSRDAETLERINVEGSRRVFEAVAAAVVPKLVHVSSVGVYSHGPKAAAAPSRSPGVYGGQLDPLPMMQIFDKGQQLRMGQAHVKQWTGEILPLLEGDDDPLGVDDLTTHRWPLLKAPEPYSMFQKKEDRAIKVVLKP
ncbi:MAG TPA: NAD-dependent epimerase/dehydratase family protein [Solirubrobacterales bacterium]|nr:NAD-dependent epimerase/dehydratase family protein [Solirubrobacterales bacterium]